MIELSFKQTNSERMVRAAATLLFTALGRTGAELVRISDIAEHPQYGFTASSVTEPVGPKYVRISDLQDGKINWDSVPYCECPDGAKYLLKENDILFARTGATAGKTHLVTSPEGAVFASYLIRIRPKRGVDAGFLYGFFQSDNYWGQIAQEKEGSAQPNVNGEKLAALRIPSAPGETQVAIADFLNAVRLRQDGRGAELPKLPTPLSEQRRIVARIEEIAAKVQEARGLNTEAKAAAKNLFDCQRFATFSKLSETHSLRALGEILSLASGEALTSSQMNASGAYRVYGGGGENGRYHRYLFEEPKIVIGRVGARCGCVFTTQPKSWITDNALYVSELSCDLDSAYAASALANLDLRQQANQAAQPVVSQKKIYPLAIPVPPIAEQRRIVAELNALQAQVDGLQKLQSETAAELDALLPSILDKAFKGEL